jgi:lipopolysaccharide heptosyltransferase II
LALGSQPLHSLPPAPRILIVRLREIGDVVFTTPAVAALRRQFPRGRLAYLVEPLAAPVVASNPHLDEVLVAPRRHAAADVLLGRRLQKQRYDLALDFHGGPRASLLTWLSRAPIRIGYEVAGRSWMYTHRVPRPRGWRPRHAVQNQWDLLAAIGVPPPSPDTSPVEMRTDEASAAAIRSRLAVLGISPRDELIVIHVSAGNPFRRWPREAFAALAAALAARDEKRRVIVTAGPSERDAAAAVIDGARTALPASSRSRVMDSGDLPLGELRALVDRATLFIGGDSGPLHVAATSRVPIVGLYGPTLPVRSAPWRDPALAAEAVETLGLECRPCDQRVCAPGDFRCLTRITPEAVLEAAERALAAGTAKIDRR